jgi:hypothetical protein
MASLFQGAPQTATSYTSSSTETPKWMQDAIYNQIQMAQSVASRPYQEYTGQRVAGLSPLQQQAYQQIQDNQGAGVSTLQNALTGISNLSGSNTAAQLGTSQNQYLQPGMAQQDLASGQGYYGQAGGMSSVGAAMPYLQNASQSATQNIGDYMNPYTQNVTDQIARLGARNLTENLLPGISDQFVRAGQFGGSRMGEFGSRALRDTQESILNQQSQALQSGYAQSLGASQSDLARQAQVGSSIGSLTGQQQQNLAQLGNLQTNAGQFQQQTGLNAASATQQAQASDFARQMAALQGSANIAQQQQGMRVADNAALEAAGLSQQQQQQAQLSSDQGKFNQAISYPQQQLDFLNTQIRGMAPIVPTNTTGSATNTGGTYGASPLSQLASGLAAYKGLSSL